MVVCFTANQMLVRASDNSASLRYTNLLYDHGIELLSFIVSSGCPSARNFVVINKLPHVTNKLYIFCKTSVHHSLFIWTIDAIDRTPSKLCDSNNVSISLISAHITRGFILSSYRSIDHWLISTPFTSYPASDKE